MPDLRGAARDMCCVVRRAGGLGREGERVSRTATRNETSFGVEACKTEGLDGCGVCANKGNPTFCHKTWTNRYLSHTADTGQPQSHGAQYCDQTKGLFLFHLPLFLPLKDADMTLFRPSGGTIPNKPRENFTIAPALHVTHLITISSLSH